MADEWPGQPLGFTADATGYHPVDPGDPEYAMEGGNVGAAEWQGEPIDQEPLYTLDQYRRGQAPYVSVAMDNTGTNPLPYGTILRSPQMPDVRFRLMDTGGAFRGRGLDRIDIARDTKAGANADENNRQMQFVPEHQGLADMVTSLARQRLKAGLRQAELEFGALSRFTPESEIRKAKPLDVWPGTPVRKAEAVWPGTKASDIPEFAPQVVEPPPEIPEYPAQVVTPPEAPAAAPPFQFRTPQQIQVEEARQLAQTVQPAVSAAGQAIGQELAPIGAAITSTGQALRIPELAPEQIAKLPAIVQPSAQMANLPAQFWNFAVSPEGLATAATFEIGGPLWRALLAAGFSAQAAQGAIESAMRGDWSMVPAEIATAALTAAGARTEARAAYPLQRPEPQIIPGPPGVPVPEEVPPAPPAAPPEPEVPPAAPPEIAPPVPQPQPIEAEIPPPPPPEEVPPPTAQPEVAPPPAPPPAAPEVAPPTAPPEVAPPPEAARQDLITRLDDALARMRSAGHESTGFYASLQAKRDAVARGEPYKHEKNMLENLIAGVARQIPATIPGTRAYAKAKAPPAPEVAPPPAPEVVEPPPEAEIQEAIAGIRKAPETAPQKMRVQKQYLLEALDQAHKSAPEEHPTSAEHGAELGLINASDPYRRLEFVGASREERAAAEQQQVAELEPLIQKYELSDYKITEPPLPEVPGTRMAAAGGPEFALEREPVIRAPTPEELVNELRTRINEARQKALPKITIEVPGDGTFEIVNSREVIAQFRDQVRKRFPTTLVRPKAAPVPRMGEAGIPKLTTPKTTEDYMKIAGRAASQVETRYTLYQTAAATEGKIVSTDGRRLIVLDKAIGDPKKLKLFDIKTGKRATEKEKGNYPNWRQVIPDPKTQQKIASLDTGEMMKLMNQAQQVMTERSKAVRIWRDKKGRLGVSGGDPEIGTFAGGPADPNTSELLVAVQPEFFADGLRIARQLGHEKVDFYLDKKDPSMSPMVMQAKGMKYVLMPMRLEGGVSYKIKGAAPKHPMAEEPAGAKMKRVKGAAAEKAAQIAEANKAAQQAAGEQAGEVYGFGGGRVGARLLGEKDKRPPQQAPSNTGEQVERNQQQALVGNPAAPGGIIKSLLSLIAPGARSPQHLQAAETLGAQLGPMHRRAEIANRSLSKYEKQFDKLGVEREDLAPADNPGTQFASAMSTGKDVGSKFEAAQAALQKQFQYRLVELRRAGAPLSGIRESYFPGMWTKESREAFNAAVQQAFEEGIIPRGSDLNEATPEQRAWVKERVDRNLASGRGSDVDMLPYLSRRPMHGKESFRKPKVFDDIMDAQEFGLRPISYNPIRVAKLKLAEIDKSIMAHNYFNELKRKGRLDVITPYEQTPPGWSQVNDPYGTIYGPPTTTLKEWVDRAVYQGMLNVADALGIKHTRAPGIGGKRLGYAVKGTGEIKTRTATELSVLAHEIGHQLDFKYDLWNQLGVPTKYGGGKSDIETELRNVADLTERGRYARKKVEKMAQVLEAYIHAPEKMREVAPTVYKRFDEFVKSVPELAPLAEIKPGLALSELQAQKYVGLPIFARRIVPQADADLLNNYLSSSLYNNRYFGKLFKGVMGTASALNQSQLGWGSGFHAGFTSADVQVSAAALVLKDLYGLIRGNRSFTDVARSAAHASIAMARTPIQGDRILNAWRDPEPSINPRVAQVVRAAELAGAGFEMERGMFTNQLQKMRSDWYSGRKLRAAARSPVAATELMAAPIMRVLVPRQKAGVFADLAWRIIEQNPGKSLEELAPQFRQAWNRVDARLGQVQYDRLFMHNIAKNFMQGTIRAPGWSGGTIAELGGAFPDAYRFLQEWWRTGRLPQEMPDRVAYATSLLLSTAIVNGALTYAFTGQQPRGLDFFAFRDGGKDEYGNETRLMLPTYMKDVLSYMRHPIHTLGIKTHPLLAMLYQLSQNKDYYGTEIRHPDDPLFKQGLQVAGFVVKQFEPFWTRGARKQYETTGGGLALPFVGIMPAPRELTETSAQRLANELVRARLPQGARTQEEFQRSQNFKAAVRDMQRGRTVLGDELGSGRLDPRNAGYAMQAINLTPLQRAVHSLDAEDAMRVWQKASPEERREIRWIVQRKVSGSRALDVNRKLELIDQLK